MFRSLNMRLRIRASRQGGTPDLERFRLFACACLHRIWHLLKQEDREAVQIIEAYTDSRAYKELRKARRTHLRAISQASDEMTHVSRDHPGHEAWVMSGWAKNL